MKKIIKIHKRHIGVLYGVVMILLALQIVSFISTSSQTARTLAEQDSIKKNIANDIDYLRRENQRNVGEMVKVISQQKDDFNKQIELLKSSEVGDFSAIIEDAVKKVVSIGTDTSAGTGFVVGDGSYIVTNHHVISGANTINVLTYDDKVLPAQIIGSDSVADIALLKINEKLSPFEFASSDEVTVGEKIIAIGNPLGLSFSVSEGIVSAVNRAGPNQLEDYIQTDTPLNPGNSGGPLINKFGKVIGVANFKVGDAEALGFALESDVAQEKINEILNNAQAIGQNA